MKFSIFETKYGIITAKAKVIFNAFLRRIALSGYTSHQNNTVFEIIGLS